MSNPQETARDSMIDLVARYQIPYADRLDGALAVIKALDANCAMIERCEPIDNPVGNCASPQAYLQAIILSGLTRKMPNTDVVEVVIDYINSPDLPENRRFSYIERRILVGHLVEKSQINLVNRLLRDDERKILAEIGAMSARMPAVTISGMSDDDDATLNAMVAAGWRGGWHPGGIEMVIEAFVVSPTNHVPDWLKTLLEASTIDPGRFMVGKEPIFLTVVRTQNRELVKLMLNRHLDMVYAGNGVEDLIERAIIIADDQEDQRMLNILRAAQARVTLTQHARACRSGAAP